MIYLSNKSSFNPIQLKDLKTFLLIFQFASRDIKCSIPALSVIKPLLPIVKFAIIFLLAALTMLSYPSGAKRMFKCKHYLGSPS